MQKIKKSKLINKISIFFTQYIKKDFRIKAIIFIIGLIIWFNINLDNQFETQIEIPIKVTKLKEGHTLLNSIPRFAKIKLKAQGKNLLFLDNENSLYFELDLKQVKRRMIYKLEPALFINTTSNKIDLLSVQHPKFIDITIDTMIHKTVPIVLQQQYKPKPGYTTTGPFYKEPDSVTVSGPKTKIDKIKKVYTIFQDALILDCDYKNSLPLVKPKDSTIKYSANEVKLQQSIVRIGYNSFRVLIQKQNVPINKNFIIDPIYVNIKVSGPVNELQKITEQDFFVYVNYKEQDRSLMQTKINIDTNIKLDWEMSSNKVKIIE